MKQKKTDSIPDFLDTSKEGISTVKVSMFPKFNRESRHGLPHYSSYPYIITEILAERIYASENGPLFLNPIKTVNDFVIDQVYLCSTCSRQ